MFDLVVECDRIERGLDDDERSESFSFSNHLFFFLVEDSTGDEDRDERGEYEGVCRRPPMGIMFFHVFRLSDSVNAACACRDKASERRILAMPSTFASYPIAKVFCSETSIEI